MCGGSRGKTLLLAFVLLVACAEAAVRVGQPLSQALEALRAQGLQIIFSSALIEPGFTVSVDPGSGSPEQVAKRILAPYGLTLNAVHPGLYSVVKDAAQSAPTPDPVQKIPPEPIAVVSVYASRYAIDARPVSQRVQFTREELDVLPGMNEDVLRVARYLPGTASSSVSARSHVRGGRENELAVYFDGVPLFEPFHFKDVQSLLGILEPQSISTVDFYSGVFPSKFGNRISGVLDIQPREWSGATYNAIGASLLYTHALSQGRLSSHPVEWLASVRRGNVDLLANALERDEARPTFVDALGRIEFDPDGPSSIAAGWLLLDDGLRANLDDENAQLNYRDSTGWLSWRLHPREDGHELSVTFSRTERHTWRDGTVDRAGSMVGSVHDRRTFDTNTARLEGGLRFSNQLRLVGGLEWYDYAARYLYESQMAFQPQLAEAFGKATTIARTSDIDVDGEAYAAHLSALVGITPRTLLDVGGRWDGQRFGSAFNANQLSPRLSLQFQRDPATTLRLSWGRFAQTERPDELGVQDGDSQFHPAQRASQLVASLERRPSSNVLLRLEAYEKRVTTPSPEYENLLDPFALLPELAIDRVRIDPDRSRAYGVEFSARWELPPEWFGWFSYGRSRVTDDFGSMRIPRTWDQKHSLLAGLNWTRGRWGASANAMWHSGWRRNDLLVLPQAAAIELAPRNSDAWHDYFSLDLRGTWSAPLPAGELQLFLEVDNVSGHDNPCCSDFRALGAPGSLELTRDVSNWLPRLLLIGATWVLP